MKCRRFAWPVLIAGSLLMMAALWMSQVGGNALTSESGTMLANAVMAAEAKPAQPVANSATKPAALPTESDFYAIDSFEFPKDEVLEVGAIAPLPGGKIAFCTRRGEVWFVDRAFDKDPAQAKFRRFAHGLHETLGIYQKQDGLYVQQRGELTRLRDINQDGTADLFDTVADGWGISGDYHEYAFCSKPDRQGDVWIVLCLTGSFTSDAPYRGWCLRVSPDGKITPTASGIRSPGGIGMNADGEMFYTENQGPWNGACSLKNLVPGSFQGNPSGNKWYALAGNTMGKPPELPKTESRAKIEAKRIPQFIPSAVYFPYSKMGQSASGVACDTTGGKFGPFSKQMFVGDQTHSTVMRVFLEKVEGRYQGACFPFRGGFGSGTLALEMTADATMFVGGTNRGWGSRGTKPFSLERLRWTGKIPFEIHEMRARPDGFELTFTQPVDSKTAEDPRSYRLSTYDYIYQAKYGSPEVDGTTPIITRAKVAGDGKSVVLTVPTLQEGHVHELHADGVRSRDGNHPLLHSAAYYTMQRIPTGKPALK